MFLDFRQFRNQISCLINVIFHLVDPFLSKLIWPLNRTHIITCYTLRHHGSFTTIRVFDRARTQTASSVVQATGLVE